MIFWIILIVAVLAVSIAIGMHLGRFREAYTEMTGMMAGMTMGMLNGFVLGYASAAAVGSVGGATGGGYITAGMFWGNLFGILLGLLLGIYFGRPGGLMGIMDGAMGGVMGGSMGAMLAVMVRFPDWALLVTAIVLALVYTVGMVGLVVLIERSAPGHEALHRLAPFFTRAIAEEVAEEYDAAEEADRLARAARTARSERAPTASDEVPAPSSHRRLVDFYAVLGVQHNASVAEIEEAYLETIDGADESFAQRIQRALEVLTDPQKREDYDKRLADQEGASQAQAQVSPPSGLQPPIYSKSAGGGMPASASRSSTGVVHPQSHGTHNGTGQKAQSGKQGGGKHGRSGGHHHEERRDRYA